MNPSSIQKKIDDFGSIINSQQQTLSNHQVAIDGIYTTSNNFILLVKCQRFLCLGVTDVLTQTTNGLQKQIDGEKFRKS